MTSRDSDRQRINALMAFKNKIYATLKQAGLKPTITYTNNQGKHRIARTGFCAIWSLIEEDVLRIYFDYPAHYGHNHGIADMGRFCQAYGERIRTVLHDAGFNATLNEHGDASVRFN